MLREEVAKRSNAVRPDTINLISAGKVLKDGDESQTLSQLGIRNNAKILASRVSVDEGKSLKQKLMAEEEGSRRLARVKAAATALSQRHVDGSLPVEDFNIELENQGGQKVQLETETDQRAVMMDLMLHENAKNLLKRQLYKDALEVLTMGEDAFSLCDPKVLEARFSFLELKFINNVPILQIDMVWSYFLLRDISWLSVVGIRLEKAREGLEHCHGKDFSRVRLLKAGCCIVSSFTTLLQYTRLELLEGVVAYHNGENIDTLQSPLFSELIRNENDFQKALDGLTNPETNSAIQLDIESRKRKRKERAAKARIEELVSMGFDRSIVAAAVAAFPSDETMEQTLSRLLSEFQPPLRASTNDTGEGLPTAADEERDVEMEDELARDIEGANALSDYDIEITKEGEAIQEYLTRLASPDGKEAQSSG
ncbi:protein OS-9-like [Hibiscus syriacus]|uniref:Protein OS-9-like n=1 Tax=Hibiscus syriacus TaxID=106335 RepID=A0A6A3BQV3_HIBSY|nr:protein OS-9-like [Hibiscus syriacus]